MTNKNKGYLRFKNLNQKSGISVKKEHMQFIKDHKWKMMRKRSLRQKKSAKMILPREENCYEIILSTNSSINLFTCGFPPFWQINST